MIVVKNTMAVIKIETMEAMNITMIKSCVRMRENIFEGEYEMNGELSFYREYRDDKEPCDAYYE